MSYPVKTNTVVLNRGLTVVQHYEDDPQYDRVVQCGPTTLYQKYEDELHEWVKYYTDTYGQNKFFKSVTLHVYSIFLPLPQSQYRAYCTEPSLGRAEIYVGYMMPDEKKFKGALSHEFGHAYHNWTKGYSLPALKDTWISFWSKQLARGVDYNPNVFPWNRPDNPYEGFANIYRCWKGMVGERLSSGSGTDDPVYDGFEDPLNHPEWEKQLDLMPETCAMQEKFGLKPGSLQWVANGASPYFQFQTNVTVDGVAAGTYIAHMWSANAFGKVWFKWSGTSWVQFSPSYYRS